MKSPCSTVNESLFASTLARRIVPHIFETRKSEKIEYHMEKKKKKHRIIIKE